MHSLTIRDAKKFLQHIAIDLREPVFVWGQPGAAKSEGIAQLAADNDALLVDVRLSQYDSVDMRGIPSLHEATKTTVWYAPSTLPFVGSAFPTDRPIVLFLDEMNSATSSVAAVAYQLINDRRVGEHLLMPNVIVIAAGNRDGDRGVTNRMPTPLANRFTHVEVVPDAEVWVEDYAAPRNLPAVGIAFLLFRKSLISTFDPSRADKAFATPRTWAKALRYYDTAMPTAIKNAAIAGAVGDGPAAEFAGFVDVWGRMPDLQTIIDNPRTVPMSDEMSMQYAIAMNISGALSLKTVTPLTTYLLRMPPEFLVMAWHMALKRDTALLGTTEFLTIADKLKKVF